MKVRAAFAVIMLVFLSSFAYAESDGKEGYDENTEIAVRGTVVEIVQRARGPVILRLKHDGRTYNVVTAPVWYLEQEGITFQTGSEWEIRGSKYFGRDGNLYLICRQMRNISSGMTIVLRDSFCAPKWMGRGMHNGR